MKSFIYTVLFTIVFCSSLNAQSASVYGHVESGSKHLATVAIYVEGTTIGQSTDESGHFNLVLPAGEHTLVAKLLGYKTQKKDISVKASDDLEVFFNLEVDKFSMDEMIVTGTRTETSRRESTIIVNALKSEFLKDRESINLAEGLNYTPGVRVESNCQNCGFTQVRMNGLEGPYSQILINSRPIFSGLAGVYGLEMIPSNMIEKIEVIRGGGSALYGNNAIAGTINLILKEPTQNSYSFGINSAANGVGLKNTEKAQADYNINFNTSIISEDHTQGMSIYAYHRDRQSYDSNGDSFSEVTKLKNNTMGARFFKRIGYRSKISSDLYFINEERRGGNMFDAPEHEADIAEAVKHNITSLSLLYEQYFREIDKLQVYASAQRVHRDSYYGAEQSLSDYGLTKDFTYTFGGQYALDLKNSVWVLGVEQTASSLNDKKKAYADLENAYMEGGSVVVPHIPSLLISDQKVMTNGFFTQYDITGNKYAITLGLRYDFYEITDEQNKGNNNNGSVFSPRISFKYDVLDALQARFTLGKGYRAPQIFDEDLHIETSGSRKVLHRNDADLTAEKSTSYMFSLDYNKMISDLKFNLLAEAFYTDLENAFANDIGEADENGVVIYTRINAEKGASVKGVNLEASLTHQNKMYMQLGYTVQESKYEEAQEFDEKSFFRTPDEYGFFVFNYTLNPAFDVNLSGVYTGRMLVPHFTDVEVLNESEGFFDMGIKLTYKLNVGSNNVEIFTGAKNLLNSYQNDLDRGIDRDPAYIYGPTLPRSIYAGIRLGSLF